jgi:hypothetical protein
MSELSGLLELLYRAHGDWRARFGLDREAGTAVVLRVLPRGHGYRN